jgi:glutathione S-transferase
VGNAIGKVLFNRVLAPTFGMPVDEQSMTDGIMFLNKHLPVAEAQIARHGNLAGEDFSLADIMLLATIDPAEVAGIDLTPYPNLVAWRNALKKEAFYTACHTDYQEVVTTLMGDAG